MGARRFARTRQPGVRRPRVPGGRRLLLAACGLLAVLLVGCPAPARRDADPGPLRMDWQQVRLPSPDGAGRILLRDLAACEGRWYAAGAVAEDSGDTRPAVWSSRDGAVWTPVPVVADSYYGRRSVLFSIACRDGAVAAVGGKVGGAHGNPRVSTWWQRGDGTLVEVAASFELYGGPRAVNVSRLAAGPAGWLIVGNRSSGAAAWVSPDAAEFTLVEGAPELSTDEQGVTWAFDALGGPAGWLAVGGVLLPGRIDRDPVVWTSADGRDWRRTVLPGTGEHEELQRVVLVDGTPVGVGLRGRAFGAWRLADAGWVTGGGFGRVGAGVPSVGAVTASAGRVMAVVSDGERYGGWLSTDGGDGWRPVELPAAAPVGAGRAVSLAAVGQRWWLAVDDGTGTSLWIGHSAAT
ncbi:hypothetical protein KIF24_00100 [Micromonospora sp. Llam7]|uniref:hypothetical protein n=1 Tax=Micromonospora tarapacensis TaxID=2835305 RepID=UPI001C834C2F|nr:hypothetical protein [Micromonospora tarapacensis]MBX7264616.1 hypothetical protein [Micromonospora tarapacensis]